MSNRALRALQGGILAPMSDGERRRFLAGRHDWQDDRWEDHCGLVGCGHSCCERNYIPESRSRAIRGDEEAWGRAWAGDMIGAP